jgi:hypothetical protein
MITIGVPVLKRYDLLGKLILSAEKGFLVPDKYLVVDNGGAMKYSSPKIEVYNPGRNIGCAAAWNYIIRNTPEIRIITNDDIEFTYDTIKLIVENYDENCLMGLSSIPGINLFSCFSLSDKIFNTIGEFDESISPNYAYFEDNDYAYRMKLHGGFNRKYVEANVNHLGSATLKVFTDEEERAHHNRFRLAKENYVAKWGGMPGEETFTKAYNK